MVWTDSEVMYKLDVFKLKHVPPDLKKLNYIVDKEVVKEDMYDDLVKKVNVIDTSGLVKQLNVMLRLTILNT